MSQIDPFATALAAAASAHQSTQQQLAAAQQQVSALAAQIAAAQTQIAGLQSQVAADGLPTAPAPTWPAAPAAPLYVPARTYCVSRSGSDATGDGSAAKPFSTYAKASAKVVADRTAGFSGLIQIAWDGGGHASGDAAQYFYDEPIPLAGQNLLLGTYNGTAALTCSANHTAPGGGAVIYGLAGAGNDHYHFVGLDILDVNPTPPEGWTYGISIGPGMNDVTIDACRIEGFTFNFSYAGGSGFRVYGSILAEAWMMFGAMAGSGAFFDWANYPDFRGNLLAHNGWDVTRTTPAWYSRIIGTGPSSAADNAILQNLMFCHGLYGRLETTQDRPSAVGSFTHNLAVGNGSIGMQIRCGGLAQYNVTANNGNACGLFTDNNDGQILDHVELAGGAGATMPLWGQGIRLQSVRGIVKNLMGVGGSSLSSNPLLTVGASENGDPTLAYRASVDTVRGLWQTNGQTPIDVQVDAARASSTTLANVRVRPPAAGETLIDLQVVFGTATEAETIALLKKNWRSGNPLYSAATVGNAIEKFLRGKGI